jgi:hypothetical protein
MVFFFFFSPLSLRLFNCHRFCAVVVHIGDRVRNLLAQVSSWGFCKRLIIEQLETGKKLYFYNRDFIPCLF